jgi:hypothetical protein
MRAFNDGRWLETEVKLEDGGNSISWGFALGEFKTATVLRINENGEWTELGELVIGERPPQKMMELKVRRSSRYSRIAAWVGQTFRRNRWPRRRLN